MAVGVKRGIDIVLSALGLAVLSPLIILVTLTVRATMGSPVLFRQQRLGYRGKPFTINKFRTMTFHKGEDGELLPDEQRLTPVGRVLRMTALDEMPELLNVLKGDMSAVGPRPLLPEYQSLYTEDEWRRHEVRPGMAGPVLAHRRNDSDWEAKFKLDIAYVDNWSLWLDLRILARTAWQVLKREGVTAQGHATAPKYQGSGDATGQSKAS